MRGTGSPLHHHPPAPGGRHDDLLNGHP